MSVDDSSKDNTLRIYGYGKTQIVAGLTNDRKRLYLGLQGKQGEIGCAPLKKKEVKKVVDRLANMEYMMVGET